MSDRKTITIDGQVAYLIQYDEIPAYDDLTWDPCTKCVCGPDLKERSRQGLHNCQAHAIPGCGAACFSTQPSLLLPAWAAHRPTKSISGTTSPNQHLHTDALWRSVSVHHLQPLMDTHSHRLLTLLCSKQTKSTRSSSIWYRAVRSCSLSQSVQKVELLGMLAMHQK